MDKGVLSFSEKTEFLEIPVTDKNGEYLRVNKWGGIIPKGKKKEDKVWFKRGKVIWGQ